LFALSLIQIVCESSKKKEFLLIIIIAEVICLKYNFTPV